MITSFLPLTLLGQSAANCNNKPRSQNLPRASVFDKLSEHDRAAVLNDRRRRLEEEVARVVLATCDGRAKFLKSARARMKRLERLAHSYGLWRDEMPMTSRHVSKAVGQSRSSWYE